MRELGQDPLAREQLRVGSHVLLDLVPRKQLSICHRGGVQRRGEVTAGGRGAVAELVPLPRSHACPPLEPGLDVRYKRTA